jgi:hypothetical protein
VTPPVPLFPGVPGGAELLVILLVLLVPGVVVAALAVGGVWLLRRGDRADRGDD